MSLSEFEHKRIQHILARYCESREPPQERGQRRLDFQLNGNVVLLRESRADRDSTGRWVESRRLELRFDPEDRTWSAYVPDPSGRWQRHALLGGWEHLEDLLDQVSGEPTAIVWG